jgi:hypothetical protein
MRFPLSGKIFSWQKISAAGRWLGFYFFQDQKSAGGSVSMSGSERLTVCRLHCGRGGAPEAPQHPSPAKPGRAQN